MTDVKLKRREIDSDDSGKAEPTEDEKKRSQEHWVTAFECLLVVDQVKFTPQGHPFEKK